MENDEKPVVFTTRQHSHFREYLVQRGEDSKLCW